MKCEIIKDLLPAYCDCVCSVETASEIEQHTANCADCKKLLEDYRSDIEPLNKVEPEKPFRRIKRGIFRNKLVIAVLVILLAGILGVVGYLTYGQIVRTFDILSFETIISSHKAKKLAEKICAGDIDSAMENIEIYQTRVALFDNQEEVREYCQTVLMDFYEKYLKGRDLNVKADLFHGYNQFMGESGMVSSTNIQIFDGHSEILSFCLVERTAGKFLMINTGYSSALGDGCDTAVE
ncbi:MAG: zf-HC2 domain-containing protein, partial [Oscillospiraceae bacterium]|nr:zf-HC2 domain-containing protein [Oscillospiraceae bacterium]